MRPKFQLLDKALIERIVGEAFQLIEDPACGWLPMWLSCCAARESRLRMA